MDSGHYEFLSQDRIIWNIPSADAVVNESERLFAKRVFIVSSRTLNRKTDAVKNIIEKLGNRFVGIFDDCREHVPRNSVIAAAAVARKVSPDLIVAIGGGTVIDTVKVMLICLTYDLTTETSLDAYHIQINNDGTQTIPELKDPPCRQIVVPTTLSGAEYSNLGGSTDPVRKIKDAYFGRKIGALSIILDPEITVHTPQWLWLSTGIRAVDHAIESICSISPIPFVDATCLHALRFLKKALPRVMEEPGDLEARMDCQHAVWLASTGIFRVPYGASHGIGGSLGAVTGMSHGHTSCILMPVVMAWNRSHTKKRQEWIAEALGSKDDAVDSVADLIETLKQPRKLRDVNVTRDQFNAIAEGALNTLWVRTNPRPINTMEQVLEILESAW